MQPTARLRPVLLALLGIGLALPGCRSPATESAPQEPPVSVAPPAATWETVARSVEGRPIEVSRFGAGPTTVLVIATLHGNESAGTPLLRELAEVLAQEPGWLAGRRVILVPVANPDGLAEERRHNARGVDLNRNFPAANRSAGRGHGASPLSEPESRALHELLVTEQPALVISIHQPVGCIDFDGPADDVAERMSIESGLPVRRLGARPGSLGSFAGVDLGIPTVTVELPPSASELGGPRSWGRYGAMLRAAVTLAP